MFRDLIIVAIGILILATALLLTPAGPYHMQAPGYGVMPEMSPFHSVTGLPGPTCGLTRSFVNTAHLKIGDAFHSHLLGPILFLGMLAFMGRSAWRLGRQRKTRTANGGAGLQQTSDTSFYRTNKFTYLAIAAASSAFMLAWAAKLILGWY